MVEETTIKQLIHDKLVEVKMLRDLLQAGAEAPGSEPGHKKQGPKPKPKENVDAAVNSYIRKNYTHFTDAKLTKSINRKFHTKFNLGVIKKKRQDLGLVKRPGKPVDEGLDPDEALKGKEADDEDEEFINNLGKE